LFGQVHGADRGRYRGGGSGGRRGAEAANGCLIDQFVISNLHPEVLVALGRTQPVQPDGALGILESFNVATMIEAADAAAKRRTSRCLRCAWRWR